MDTAFSTPKSVGTKEGGNRGAICATRHAVSFRCCELGPIVDSAHHGLPPLLQCGSFFYARAAAAALLVAARCVAHACTAGWTRTRTVARHQLGLCAGALAHEDGCLRVALLHLCVVADEKVPACCVVGRAGALFAQRLVAAGG